MSKELIDKIKKSTDLCDTFSCYENCDECVTKYLAEVKNKEEKDNE